MFAPLVNSLSFWVKLPNSMLAYVFFVVFFHCKMFFVYLINEFFYIAKIAFTEQSPQLYQNGDCINLYQPAYSFPSLVAAIECGVECWVFMVNHKSPTVILHLYITEQFINNRSLYIDISYFGTLLWIWTWEYWSPIIPRYFHKEQRYL